MVCILLWQPPVVADFEDNMLASRRVPVCGEGGGFTSLRTPPCGSPEILGWNAAGKGGSA